MTPAPHRPAPVITFYSFKGGTGRSMALANTAWILASNGHRVLAVDWDLESPGLHRYFHPFLVDKTLRSSPGVLDLVRDYAGAALEPSVDLGDDRWFQERASILPYAASLDWDFPGGGSIDLVPAGRQSASYSQAVSTFDWDTFYERLGGGALLRALRDDMRRQYDYVLIDSRTGLSDSASICTVHLPDVVVDCFTLSTQSIDGAAAVAASIAAQSADRPIRVVPVLMRTDASEKLKLDAGREAAQERFATVLGDGAPSPHWTGVEIPYVPYYAFEEILTPFGDPPGQATTLLAAFERLTSRITDGEVPGLVPMDENLRRRHLSRFERPRRARSPRFSVLYSAADRAWAEWVRAELTGAGVRARLTCVDLLDRPAASVPEPAGDTVALLSRTFTESPRSASVWRASGNGSGSRLVSLQLDGAYPPSPFDEPPPVDLTGLSETEAHDRLLRAVGLDPGGARDDLVRGAPARFPRTRPATASMQPRNATFAGRAGLLEDLRDRLCSGGAEVQAILLHGLAGVGKTQIANEYAHRFASRYDVVWWIPAEQPGVMRASLTRLARELRLPEGDDPTADVPALLAALSTEAESRPRLLVFDNLDDPHDVIAMLPQRGPLHVLLTSRSPGGSMPERIEVPVFSRDQSVSLLLRRTDRLRPADADAVAERLGDLPLAIDQAGAWLAETGMAVTTYLDLLDTRLGDVLARQQVPDYPHTVAAAWLLSLDRLRAQRPAAARLMELCACFASEPIATRWLLKEPALSLLAGDDLELRDPLMAAQLFSEVSRYALASVDAHRGVLEVHRLVHVVIQEQMAPEHLARVERVVLEVLVAASPGDTDDPQNWPRYAELWPHVSALALESDAREVRLLVLDVVRYLWRSGDRAAGRELAERAVARWTPRFGPDDPITLRVQGELSNILHVLGEYAAALTLSEDVVCRMGRVHGADHPYRLIAMIGMTGRLMAVGRYDEARTLSLEILEPTRAAFGSSDTRFLNALNMVATMWRFAGDFRKSLALTEELYELSRGALGPLHPDSLRRAISIGRDLRTLGEFTRSRAQLEPIIEDLASELTEDHPLTILGRSSLAVTWRKLGRLADAHALSTSTLDLANRVLGAVHPDRQAVNLNLACDEAALGRFGQAAERTRLVLDGYLRQHGHSHYLPLIVMTNLAVFVRETGHRAEALGLSRTAWHGLRQALGDRHPTTLAARVNHASDLAVSGNPDAAATLGAETFTLLGEVLGPGHPDTLTAGLNLALDRWASGSEDAEPLRLTSLRLLVERLGEQHPHCILAAERRRLHCDVEQALL